MADKSDNNEQAVNVACINELEKCLREAGGDRGSCRLELHVITSDNDVASHQKFVYECCGKGAEKAEQTPKEEKCCTATYAAAARDYETVRLRDLYDFMNRHELSVVADVVRTCPPYSDKLHAYVVQALACMTVGAASCVKAEPWSADVAVAHNELTGVTTRARLRGVSFGRQPIFVATPIDGVEGYQVVWYNPAAPAIIGAREVRGDEEHNAWVEAVMEWHGRLTTGGEHYLSYYDMNEVQDALLKGAKDDSVNIAVGGTVRLNKEEVKALRKRMVKELL